MKTYAEVIPAKSILKDFTVQIRAAQSDKDTSYDITGMRSSLLTVGFVKTPLAVEKMKSGKVRVLQGFTRLLALDSIENDPNLSEEIKAKFREVQCQVYEDIDDKFRDELVYDDQSQKKLTKVEVIRWLWRLAETQDYSDIVWRHFRQLVHLATPAKQDEFNRKMKDEFHTEQAQRKYIVGFFQGTINDEILKAKSLGPIVQRAFIETVAGRTEGPDCEFVCNRGALGALGIARSRDLGRDQSKHNDWKEGVDGMGWNQQTGGIRFNAELARLRAAKGKVDDDKPKVLTSKAIDDRIIETKSRLGKIVYKIAKGGKDLLPDERNFAEIDMNVEALESIQAFTISKLDEILANFDEPMQNLLKAIAYTKGSSADFEMALTAMLPKAKEPEAPKAKEPKAKAKESKAKAK